MAEPDSRLGKRYRPIVNNRTFPLDSRGSGSCPACQSPNQHEFFEMRSVPIDTCVLYDTPEQAREAAMGDIVLSYCPECGFINNRSFAPQKVKFEPGYEVSLVYSDVFDKFQRDLSERLVSTYELKNKRILEIGCGTGSFLRLLCQLGNNKGIGLDPTLAEEGTEKLSGGGEVTLIRDFYSSRYDDLKPDFICCLSVFECIPEPFSFLDHIRRSIEGRDAAFYCEVFNAFRAFQKREFWSPHYEACNYFSLDSLKGLFERCFFQIADSGFCYGADQYIYVEARPGTAIEQPQKQGIKVSLKPPQNLLQSGQMFRQSVQKWSQLLDSFRAQKERMVLWGSGGKGTSFLNVLDTAGVIEFVVDINPKRQGQYIPGSAQKIVAPEFLVDYRPGHVILSNPLYEEEIRAQVKALKLDCEFINL